MIFWFCTSGFLSILAAQDSPGIAGFLNEYASLLGMTIDQAYEKFGSPDHLYTYQNERDAAGSVVFSYASSFSFFWVDDRVWQLRLDEAFSDPEHPLLIGQPMGRFLSEWGEPVYKNGELLIYEVADADFPIRCALYFNEADILIDLYLFRSDY